MYIEMTDLVWLCLMMLAAYHWWRAQKVKEMALRHTRRHCEEMEVQLLDDSIGLRGFWLKRDDNGQLRFWRSYNFEFTATGDDRFQGRTVMLGEKLSGVQLGAYRI